MVNVAHERRRELEGHGEYVVTANAPTGWFAMFPATWRARLEQARRGGREGPNLIVYRTISNQDRDHYRVPYSIVCDLLVSTTLTTSTVDGSQRWNLTLKDDHLHVTHRAGSINVRKFHGALLIVEESEFTEPTADLDVLASRVRVLRKGSLDRPLGQPSPRRVEGTSRTVFERRADVKAWVLQQGMGQCELCRNEAPFTDDDGEPHLELHHVVQLAHGGPDTVENAVAVCPNCHQRLHHGADRKAQRDLLYSRVSRLLRPIPSP